MKPKQKPTPTASIPTSQPRTIADPTARALVAALRYGHVLPPETVADLLEAYALDLQDRDHALESIRNRIAALGLVDASGAARVTLVSDYLKPTEKP